MLRCWPEVGFSFSVAPPVVWQSLMQHAGKGAGKGEAEELAASTHDKAGRLSRGLKRVSASGNQAFGVQLWGPCRVSLG